MDKFLLQKFPTKREWQIFYQCILLNKQKILRHLSIIAVYIAVKMCFHSG